MHDKAGTDSLSPNYQDHLTGLPNAMWLSDNIDRFVAEQGTKLAALFIDGDGLKMINDEYNHQEGDEYIKFMSGAILDSVRGSDVSVAVHRSGDEFIILLTNITDDDSVAVIAARIEENLDEIGAPASVGCARYQVGEDAGEFILRADEDMYNRKKLANVNRGPVANTWQY